MPPFLSAGGDAGALVRSRDWSTTPLGPIDSWPAALKTTIGTLLHSRHPMFLFWGPDLIQFYNDAYLPSFGKGKHPGAMGQRGEDCWPEIWPIIGPQIDDVMSRGRSSWNEDHLVPIFRNGRLEEVYWTYGYSPVFDDDGRIGGTLVVCTETTSRVLAQRRLQSMRALADAMLPATTVLEVVDGAAGSLSNATGDIPFALVYQVHVPLGGPRLMRAVGLTARQAADLDAHFRDRLDVLSADATPSPLPPQMQLPGRPWPEPVSDVFVSAIGTDAPHSTGFMVFGLSPRLAFDSTYREYLRQVCAQTRLAQARIEAFHLRAVVEHERNSLLEQAPVATALLTGADHVFRLANPLFKQMVGRTDIVDRTYREAFPELVDTPLAAILDRVYETGQPFVTNEMFVRLDRTGNGVLEDCYFKFNLEPMRGSSGQVYGMMAVAADITPQVVARMKVEQVQAEREALLLQLESANRAKDEFLAMLGHELRNPLSPILTALQLMRLRGVRGADAERTIIERQVKHVVTLVDDLLDVSRITRGMIELKRGRVQLAEVVAKAIEQASPLIEQRRHRLDVDMADEFYVDGDSGRLSQIVANLLTNAAKYTAPGGEIGITAQQRGDEVVMTICDNGIGISADMLPHVFDAFAQERQRSDRSQGGLGLGLAIVKSLVEAHGGSVAIRSNGPGRGTECIVRLPVAAGGRPAPSVHSSAMGSAAPFDGCRVLLVDDNVDAAEMLGEALRALGHSVEVAFDAPSALAIAARYNPDVAVLDLGLPVIDGYDLAARLRGLEGWETVRFIALTGYGQQNDREHTRSAGFDAHLVKPIDIQDVDATLRGARS